MHVHLRLCCARSCIRMYDARAELRMTAVCEVFSHPAMCFCGRS